MHFIKMLIEAVRHKDCDALLRARHLLDALSNDSAPEAGGEPERTYALPHATPLTWPNPCQPAVLEAIFDCARLQICDSASSSWAAARRTEHLDEELVASIQAGDMQRPLDELQQAGPAGQCLLHLLSPQLGNAIGCSPPNLQVESMVEAGRLSKPCAGMSIPPPRYALTAQ